MNFKSTVFAALLGLSLMGVPAIASAHPHPRRAYRRAMVAARFHSMSRWNQKRFLYNHPYLSSHRWKLNQHQASQNAARAAHWSRNHQFNWNNGYQGAYAQEPDGDEATAPGYSNVPPGWRHREPDGDDYHAACGGDDDADDCGGPASYSYGAPGNGYGYGNGGQYYRNSYGNGGYAWSNMLPMIQQFIP